MHHREKKMEQNTSESLSVSLPHPQLRMVSSSCLYQGQRHGRRNEWGETRPVNSRQSLPGHAVRKWESWSTGPHYSRSPIWNGLQEKPMSGVSEITAALVEPRNHTARSEDRICTYRRGFQFSTRCSRKVSRITWHVTKDLKVRMLGVK